MQSKLAILLVLILSACGDDVRGLRLADVDMSNMVLVKQLGQKLSSTDRSALITYAAIHNPASAGFCGDKLAGRDGAIARTVGDAIDLTLERESQSRATARVDPQKTSAELIGERQDGLIAERDLLIDRESFLLADHGRGAKQLAEWKSLEFKKANYDKRLEALRRQLLSLRG